MKAALLAIAALCACDRELNPEFCLAHPDDLRCGGVDGATACATNDDCPGEVCDTAASPAVCVACTTSDVSACAATAPVCSADNQCRGCVTDDECTSNACLPDGSCAAEADVIYVTVGGVAATGCGARDNPCSIMQSILEVAGTRTIIKLEPNAGQDYQVSTGTGLTIDKDVTLIARGASFGRVNTGPIFTVVGGRTATILGGVIKGGVGSAGHGIACTALSVVRVSDADIGPNEGDGINANTCGLFLDRVVIHNNDAGVEIIGGSIEVSRSTFSTNLEGGIDLSGSNTRFVIVNNVFWKNGIGGTVGGVLLSTNTSTTSKLELNSFNQNNANFGIGTAVHCLVAGFVARNNVMFGNGLNNLEQVGGTCTHTYSIASPGTLPVGTGNTASDPLFVSAGTGNLHTMAGSPTEGAGDPASDLTGLAATDVDGDPRATPPDIGIDEHP
jgi:hypothetical protein